MILIEDQKADVKPTSDQPPAYNTLSHRRAASSLGIYRCASSAVPILAGPSNDPTDSDSLGNLPLSQANKSLPPPRPCDNPPSSPRKDSALLTQRQWARKNISWLTSLLPFVSSISAKRVRQSVLSIVSDLVVLPSRTNIQDGQSSHEILASVAETCTEHKVSLAAILQEAFIADHTPMYWAIVNYRQELLVALLVHSRPLSLQSISDIRRACLVGSNQALFHALRTCRPPFHRTNGIQVPSLRTASDNLLMGNRPTDEIHVLHASDDAFTVNFTIPLWQKRMKVTGQVDIEFIASSRMWSITFFSTDPSLPVPANGKLRKAANTWHVMITLMESSLPTFLDSKLVVDVPLPQVPKPIQKPRLREARSTTFPSVHEKRHFYSVYDYNYDEKAHGRTPFDPFENDSPCSSSHNLPPPTHPLRGSLSPRSSTATAPSISIPLRCGNRQLARRAGTGDSMETPTIKPEKWWDHGVGYANAAVAPLVDGPAGQLLYEHSRYLLPGGTLRGRLEARLVKTESSKDCIIC